ncbi:hypothetical protein BB561_005147 [Smittium simulii]|uniref:Uncharacterized protein n=1 Tax=Smittium simulii TaxID=133385 RepID=A0A2T9YBY8_9FUNG|nr:hypothetical protein BB561_005147 [Smittium simulii]
MEEHLLQTIRELANKVNGLYISRETQIFQPTTSQTPKFNDPHVRIRARPLKDDESKEFIQGCPMFVGMKYQTHPLNEVASLTVKKTYSAIYCSQLALANITRPLIVARKWLPTATALTKQVDFTQDRGNQGAGFELEMCHSNAHSLHKQEERQKNTPPKMGTPHFSSSTHTLTDIRENLANQKVKQYWKNQLYYFQKNWRSTSRIIYSKIKLTCRTKKLQNEISKISLFANKKKDFMTSLDLENITSNTDVRIFGQPSDPRIAQRNMYGKYRAGIFEANRAWIQDQNKKFLHYSNPIHKPLGNNN